MSKISRPVCMSRLDPILLLLLLAATACRGQAAGEPAQDAGAPRGEALVVYSGRGQKLVGPLLRRFQEEKGIPLKVRYGETSELAATLLEEGQGTPAQLFLAQDIAELGALSRAGLLRPLPQDVLEILDTRFRSARGDWVGLTGRARVVVYNTQRTQPDALPQRLEQVGEPRYRGSFGIAPNNASFQAHMAYYAAVNGEAALRELLAAIARNEPRVYANNNAIVQAVIAGEIDWGLVNHYYLWRALQENPTAPARNFFMSQGRGSSFMNLSGAGLLGLPRPEAVELLRFLLSEAAQRYFAEEVFELPLIAGVPQAGELPALDSMSPLVDYAEVSTALEGTLQLIHESGLSRFQ